MRVSLMHLKSSDSKHTARGLHQLKDIVSCINLLAVTILTSRELLKYATQSPRFPLPPLTSHDLSCRREALISAPGHEASRLAMLS